MTNTHYYNGEKLRVRNLKSQPLSIISAVFKAGAHIQVPTSPQKTRSKSMKTQDLIIPTGKREKICGYIDSFLLL